MLTLCGGGRFEAQFQRQIPMANVYTQPGHYNLGESQ